MRLIWVVLVLVTACATARPATTTMPDGSEIAAEDVSPEVLLAELRGAVLESYQALAGGYEEAFLDGLAHDDRLLVLDVTPSSTLVGYSAVVARVRRLFGDETVSIVSKALEAHVSQDGTVGWTHDELSYRVRHDGKRAIVILRATTTFERRDGRWVVVASHVSYGTPEEDLLAEAVLGRVPKAKVLGEGVVGKGAGALRTALTALLRDDNEGARKIVSLDPDALFLGVDSAREKRGSQVAEAPSVRALFGYEYEVRPGNLQVQVGRSGKAAWAAGLVTIVGTVDDKPVELPLRVTWVLEQRKDAWTVVQTHVSAAITRGALAGEVFGDAAATP